MYLGRFLGLVGFDVGGDCIDALEVFLSNARHGYTKVGIHKGNNFKGIHRVEANFFTEKRGIELEHVTIDAEIRHKEGLEFFFHFIHIIPRNFFETKIEKNNKCIVNFITKATYRLKLRTKCIYLVNFLAFFALKCLTDVKREA